jgi:HSP20 family protein
MFGRNLRCFDPWRELREMEYVLDRMWDGERPRGFPVVNIFTSGDAAVVMAELPGVDPGDMDLSVNGDALTISGERKSGEPAEGETFHRRERRHGKFSRTVALPFGVESGQVDAGFKNGVLTITLPRAEAEKPRKIAITDN